MADLPEPKGKLSTVVTLKNETSSTLVLVKKEAMHGHFTQGAEPPDAIYNESPSWMMEADQAQGGLVGYAQYRLDSGDLSFTLRWGVATQIAGREPRPNPYNASFSHSDPKYTLKWDDDGPQSHGHVTFTIAEVFPGDNEPDSD